MEKSNFLLEFRGSSLIDNLRSMFALLAVLLLCGLLFLGVFLRFTGSLGGGRPYPAPADSTQVADTTRAAALAAAKDSTVKGQEDSSSSTTFSYVGRLKVDEQLLEALERRKAGGRGRKDLPAGLSEAREGVVPEISVVYSSEGLIDRVTARHGFLPVVASGQGLMGALDCNTGQLSPLSQRTLDQYSPRARSFGGYKRALLRALEQRHPSWGRLRLLFLVPKAYEKRVIARQRVFARSTGVPLWQINLMEGHYDPRTLEIIFDRVYLKDGQIIIR